MFQENSYQLEVPNLFEFRSTEKRASEEALQNSFASPPEKRSKPDNLREMEEEEKEKCEANKSFQNSSSFIVPKVSEQSVPSTSESCNRRATSIIHMLIENLNFHVTLEFLRALFSAYGKVLKIVTFIKDSTFQAFIQMMDSDSVQRAQQGLHGLNIFPNFCMVKIYPSWQTDLQIKFNNETSQDYTNPMLPYGENLSKTSTLRHPSINPQTGFSQPLNHSPFSTQLEYINPYNMFLPFVSGSEHCGITYPENLQLQMNSTVSNATSNTVVVFVANLNKEVIF